MDQVDESLDVRSLQDRVYGRIRDAMRKGVFKAGQTLTIRALAARFGTSEMPVREAIKRLVAEKALVQQADRTFKIPAVTADRFQDVLLVRTMVEGRAAELAAAAASADLVDNLQAANRRMVEALSCSDVKGILEHNQTFHFLIYESCGNETLLDIIEMLWLRSGPYLAELAADRAGIDAFFDAASSHDRIIGAIKLRDTVKASRFLRDDIETTARWFWSRFTPAVSGDGERASAFSGVEPRNRARTARKASPR